MTSLLKRINKGNRRRHIEAAFAYAAEAGLNRIAYSIVGLPGETRDMVLETIEILRLMNAEWNVVSPISLMPGTPLYERMSDSKWSSKTLTGQAVAKELPPLRTPT